MKRLYIITMLALAAAGCTKEQDRSEGLSTEVAGPSVTRSFTSSLEGEYRTKTVLGNEAEVRSVKWAEGDQIKIISGDGSEVVAGIGTDGQIEDVTLMQSVTYYGVYPADTETASGIDGLTFTIPSTQNGKFEDANLMVATADDNERKFHFMNMVSMLQLDIEGDYDKVIIRSNDGSALVGKQTVLMKEDGTIGSIAASETAAQIELNINGSGTYYVALLAGAKLPAGLGFRFFKDGKPVAGVLSVTAIDAERSSIRTLAPTANITSEWYISPDGKGNGLSAQTPGNARLLTSLLSVNIAEGITNEGYTNAWRINGATIHLAEGSYTLKDCKIDFKEAVEFSVEGPSDGNATLTTAAGTIMTIISNCKASFSKVTFSGGSAAENGGAVYITKGEARFNQCVFDSNSAAVGAHIALNTANPKVFVNRCVFKNGTANTTSTTNWLGAAINSANTGATLCINNSVFYNNGSSKITSNDGLPCIRTNGVNTLIMNSSFHHKGLRAINPTNGGTDAHIINNAAASASATARGLANSGTRKYNLTNKDNSADDTNYGDNSNLSMTWDESTNQLKWTLNESVTIARHATVAEVSELVGSKFAAFDTWLKSVETNPYGIDFAGNTRNSSKMNPGAWDEGLN